MASTSQLVFDIDDGVDQIPTHGYRGDAFASISNGEVAFMSIYENEPELAAVLVEKIGIGDLKAEATFVVRYSRKLMTMLQRRTGDPNLSHDLHQDTFATVLEKMRQGKVKNGKGIAGYLYRVAHNLLVAHYRKVSRWTETAIDEDMLCRATSPDVNYERSEEMRIVRMVLDQLKSQLDREIIFRFYLGDEDKASICKALGIQPAGFDLVLFRARRRFKALWLKRGLSRLI